MLKNLFLNNKGKIRIQNGNQLRANQLKDHNLQWKYINRHINNGYVRQPQFREI